MLFEVTNAPIELTPFVGFKFIALAFVNVDADQLNAVPTTSPEKEYKRVLSPAQREVSLTPKTVGIGLTVIEKFTEGPEHPFNVGVALIFPVI